MTRTHCSFVGSAGSDLSIYIYRQRGSQWDFQKVALLLHTGGTDFQELYYTLIPEGEETSLEESFEVLDDYFVPKVNVPFERHLFRQMSQVAGETVDQFVCRLRQKAITCDFPNVDEAIKDQLIESSGNSDEVFGTVWVTIQTRRWSGKFSETILQERWERK